MSLDLTPGFNLGVSDALKKIGNAANSFVGSSGNSVVFNNPTGSASTSSKPQKSTGSQGVLGVQTTAPPTPTPDPYTGNGDPTGNAANVAAYQDNLSSLQQLLADADTSRTSGTNNLDRSYQNSLNRLQNSQNQALQGYETQRGDTTNDYQKTLGRINDQARTGYNSLQALLGGTGSAGDVLAPFAVSQQASKQRGVSSDSFAHNLRDIDTATTQTNQGFDDSRNDLLGQHNGKLQELLNSIDTQKKNYLAQIGATKNQLNIAKGGGYTTPTDINNQISALQREQAGLSDKYAEPTYNVRDVNVAAPNLAQYQAQAASIANGDNTQLDTSADDQTSALAQLLKLKNLNQPSYSY